MIKLVRVYQNVHSHKELCRMLGCLSSEEITAKLWESILTSREWEKVVESSIDGIFLADGTGMALYANKAYEEISGLSRTEIEGVQLREFLSRGYVDKAGSLMVLSTKRPTTIESCFSRTGKHALITCNPSLGPDGEISITVSNVRDLTEINRLKEQREKRRALISFYKAELEQNYTNQDLVARDPSTIRLLNVARQVAKVDSTVLITGETGAGKEVVAKYIHDNSPRSKEHFIRINCSAIAENLFESELFGYEKGAFTGARAEGKVGLFEIADKGTIFLDEIGELPQNLQAKLLRVLQEKEFTRVGGVKPVKTDVRVLAATNRNMQQMVADKLFRLDLYYRLNVVPLQVPPLRERPEDILPLASLFVQKMNRKYGYEKKLTPNAEAQMRSYSWPGNIRELRNVIERAVILSTSDDVEVQGMLPPVSGTLGDQGELPHDLPRRLRQLEYAYMKRAYELHGSVRDAARALGMKKSTFAEKLQIYMHQYENQDGV